MSEEFKAMMLEVDTITDIDDLKKWKNYLSLGSKIAKYKIIAIDLRRCGEIHQALKTEDRIDKLYNKLPKNLRW